MIDDDSCSVVVPWPSDDTRSRELERSLEHLRNDIPSGIATYRVLQDATISLRTRQVEHCITEGLLMRLGSSDLYEWIGPYDRQLGIIITSLNQKDLII
jgi:hypothetical protein